MAIKWYTKLYKNFREFCSLIRIVLIEVIIISIRLIRKCLKICKLFLMTHRLSIIQLICVSVMICNGFVLISDYLNFDYELKQIISDKDGIDLTAISVCTERNVLFNKRNILQYFDLNREYSELENKLKTDYDCSICRHRTIYNGDLDNLVFNHIITFACCKHKYYFRFYKLERFLYYYEYMIFDQFSYDELIVLTMSEQQLFECQASVHYKNQTFGSNSTTVENCFHSYRVSRDIYANNDFGICYKFFGDNYQIRLINNDYIKIKIKYESFRNLLMMNLAFDRFNNINLDWQRHFRFYYFADSETNHMPTKDTVILTQNNGLKKYAYLQRSLLEMLSTPYMQ